MRRPAVRFRSAPPSPADGPNRTPKLHSRAPRPFACAPGVRRSKRSTGPFCLPNLSVWQVGLTVRNEEASGSAGRCSSGSASAGRRMALRPNRQSKPTLRSALPPEARRAKEGQTASRSFGWQATSLKFHLPIWRLAGAMRGRPIRLVSLPRLFWPRPAPPWLPSRARRRR